MVLTILFYLGLLLTTFIIYKYFTLIRVNLKDQKNHLPEDYLKNIPEDVKKKLDPDNMLHYWYPIAFSTDIQDKPYGTKIYRRPIVLYRSKNGKVVCSDDVCPHRSAQLSIGKIRNGNLECPYHGWEFGDEGKCQRIPSVGPDSNMKELVCLKNLPVVEDLGIVFIWPGEEQLADSSLVPRYIFREREWKGWEFVTENLDVDLPAPILIENVLDYAHIDFVHDGTIGKRSRAAKIESKESTDDPYTKVGKYSFCHEYWKPTDPGKFPYVSIAFIAPCFVKIRIEMSPGKYFHQIDAYVPLEENKTKVFFTFHQTFIPLLVTGLFLDTDFGRYLSKRSNRNILKQDIDCITTVHNNINNNKSKPYTRIVQADASIKKFREGYWNKMKKPWFKGYNDIEDIVK